MSIEIHEHCKKCGYCIQCGDCKTYGCGRKKGWFEKLKDKLKNKEKDVKHEAKHT
jgi:hypothetical protein